MEPFGWCMVLLSITTERPSRAPPVYLDEFMPVLLSGLFLYTEVPPVKTELCRI